MAEVSELIRQDGSRTLLGLTDKYRYDVIDTNFYGHVFICKKRGNKNGSISFIDTSLY